MTTLQEISELIYRTLTEVLKDKKIDAGDIIKLTVMAIKLVQMKVSELSGEEKKKLVISLLYRVIEEQKKGLTLEEAMILDAMLQSLPELIDTMIGIAKRTVDLGKSVHRKCLGLCRK